MEIISEKHCTCLRKELHLTIKKILYLKGFQSFNAILSTSSCSARYHWMSKTVAAASCS